MNRAVSIKLKDPSVSLMDALQMAGFLLNSDGSTGNGSALDGVAVSQRKNQLCRRLRTIRRRLRRRDEDRLQQLVRPPSNVNKRLSPTMSTQDSKHNHPKPQPDPLPSYSCDSVAASRDTASVEASPLCPKPPAGSLCAFPRSDKTLDNDSEIQSAVELQGNGERKKSHAGKVPSTGTVGSSSGPVSTEEAKKCEDTEKKGVERVATIVDLHHEGLVINSLAIPERLSGELAVQENIHKPLPLLTQSLLAKQWAEARTQSLLAQVWDTLQAIQKGAGPLPPIEGTVLAAMVSESDDRIEKFLLREDFNVQRAALRLVKYWTKRFEIFGADKFNLPMTPNGALRGDEAIIALASTTIKIMPGLDGHGRKVVYRGNIHNAHEGYTASGMIRAIWYIFDSLINDPNAKNGIVLLTQSQHTGLGVYGKIIDTFISEFESEILPMRICERQVIDV